VYPQELYVTNVFPLEISGKDNMRVFKISPRYLTISTTYLKKLLMIEARSRNLLNKVRIGFGFRGVMYIFASNDIAEKIEQYLKSMKGMWRNNKVMMSVKASNFDLNEHAVPFSQIVHESILERLDKKNWIIVYRYRVFTQDLEYDDVPKPFSELVRVFKAIEIRTLAYIQKSWLKPHFRYNLGIMIDPRIRIEPCVSLLDLKIKYKINLEALLHYYPYLVTFCPILDCKRKAYNVKLYQSNLKECPYGIKLKGRLHEVNKPSIVNVTFDAEKCNLLKEFITKSDYPSDELSKGIELLRWIKQGKSPILHPYEMPLSLVSIEPRPENIDLLVEKFIRIKPKTKLTKYIKVKSHQIREDGKLNEKAAYERMLETEEIIREVILKELSNLEVLEGVKVNIIEEEATINLIE